jgi:crotonobetainyl-CoA:carnitine CoA-transferase CaiB-like acyl-CoA transferase
MFDDPHLAASGGLGETTLLDGKQTRLPKLPLEMDGQRPSQGGMLARPGQHTDEVLQALGLSTEEIVQLRNDKVVG